MLLPAVPRPLRPRPRALPPLRPAWISAGCMEPAQQAVHLSWLREMGAFLRRVDPNHLVAAATEGFFMENATTNYHLYNPGGVGWGGVGWGGVGWGGVGWGGVGTSAFRHGPCTRLCSCIHLA
jgi:hypothetical protein